MSDWLTWQVVDSAFPTGAFAHSFGLESAWQQGEVEDLGGAGSVPARVGPAGGLRDAAPAEQRLSAPGASARRSTSCARPSWSTPSPTAPAASRAGRSWPRRRASGRRTAMTELLALTPRRPARTWRRCRERRFRALGLPLATAQQSRALRRGARGARGRGAAGDRRQLRGPADAARQRGVARRGRAALRRSHRRRSRADRAGHRHPAGRARSALLAAVSVVTIPGAGSHD